MRGHEDFKIDIDPTTASLILRTEEDLTKKLTEILDKIDKQQKDKKFLEEWKITLSNEIKNARPNTDMYQPVREFQRIYDLKDGCSILGCTLSISGVLFVVGGFIHKAGNREINLVGAEFSENSAWACYIWAMVGMTGVGMLMCVVGDCIIPSPKIVDVPSHKLEEHNNLLRRLGLPEFYPSRVAWKLSSHETSVRQTKALMKTIDPAIKQIEKNLEQSLCEQNYYQDQLDPNKYNEELISIGYSEVPREAILSYLFGAQRGKVKKEKPKEPKARSCCSLM